jgi:hypothetical protein
VITFFAPDSTSEEGEAGAHPATKEKARIKKPHAQVTLAEEKLLKTTRILTSLLPHKS